MSLPVIASGALRGNLLRMSLWAKQGEHQGWVEAAIRINAKDNGGKVLGNPTCLVRTFKTGLHTVLGAEGKWWHEHMAVHGKDWSGPVDDQGRELEDLLSSSI
jgi:hypothetical protein